MEGGFSLRFFEGQSSNFGFPTTSFPELLTGNLQNPEFYGVNPTVGYSLLGPSTISQPNALSFGPVSYVVEDHATFQQKKLMESSNSTDRRPRVVDFRSGKLKFPKLEPVSDEAQIIPAVGDDRNTPFGFPTDEVPKICTSSFHRLPDLLSVEQIPGLHGFSTARSAQNRFGSLALPAPVPTPSPPLHFPPKVYPRCTLPRQRRKKISDRTRQLEKLMPWEKKMDIATTLEEAHKYIRFLEAQVSVLKSMPRESNFVSLDAAPVSGGEAFGEVLALEKLNRQQLLQVLVNSAVVQEKLYSGGCCVFSVEQVVVLKKMAERKVLLQQIMMLG
ncbi:uncharacterized protein LOC131221659 [Magnolia sinica]|uniref:uncharacterized protein LOC131221659 n=1 Tax=Magnolia sinica TaxID=86752 RepID=UPI002658D258|nr:uncharacterized protein LOC131221659 [Magnolia sinica]